MMRVRVKKKEFDLVAKVRVPLRCTINMNQYDVLEKNIHMGYFKLQDKKGRKLELKGSIGISLYKRMKAPISQYDFFYIIERIVDFIQKIEKLELAYANLVLDLKSIFYNETTKELNMIYLPIVPPCDNIDMMSFMNRIVYSAIPMEGTDYISSFNYFLKNLGGFDAEKIKAYIYSVNEDVMKDIKKKESKSVFVANEMDRKQNDEPTDLTEDNELTDISSDENTEMAANNLYVSIGERRGMADKEDEKAGLQVNETTEFKEEEKTDWYEDVQISSCPTLVRKVTGEVIKIDKLVFRLGKEKGCVNYVIGGNTLISHNHADIICREGKYFVLDLHSKNRTCINNKVLPTEKEVEICNGDTLKLANEEFTFQI